ncbi:MAG: hypothetical protein AAF614_32590 [Chloroflexota bacterium]
MSFTLQAIIVEKPAYSVVKELGLRIIDLPCELFLIPLTSDYVHSNNIPFLPLTDDGITEIEGNLLKVCLNMSSEGKVAYVEAEFFGGQGTQGCILFERGAITEAARVNTTAINYALRWLGIRSSHSQDEFTVAGLSRHRKTEEWLNT